MACCCVKTCKSVQRLMTPDVQISFHRVPKKEFAMYMKMLGLAEEPHRTKYICSLHFADEDFVYKGKRKFLKEGTLPSKSIGKKPIAEAVVARNRDKTDQRPSTSKRTEVDVTGASKLLEEPAIMESGSASRQIPVYTTEARGVRRHSSSSTLSVSTPEKIRWKTDESPSTSSQRTQSYSTGASKLREQPPVVESSTATIHTPVYETETRGFRRHSSSSSVSVATPEKRRCSPRRRFAWQQPVQNLSESDISSVSEGSRVKTRLAKGTHSHRQDVSKVENGSSSSLSEGSKAKRRTFVKAIHSYSISPRKMKAKLEQAQKKVIKSAKQLYAAKKTIHKLKQKISSLTEVLEDLKKQRMVSDSALDHLERTTADIPKTLLMRYLKNVEIDTISREDYPACLKKFAATLQFYSCKAYDYVRETFAFALPHPSTLRKWYSAVDCKPGFQSPCFEVLTVETAKKKPVICSLLMDEMAIKKKIEFDGTKTWGYIDFGVDMEDDDLEACTEALVLLIVAHNNTWKLPIAYFLIKGLTGTEKANIIREALIRLTEVNVTITSVTCDGPASHFTMFSELGCDWSDIFNIQSYFFHPVTNTKVYAIFDVCHMLKLLRNCLATLGILLNADEEQICWKYIVLLHELQEKTSLRAGNRLRKAHIEWERQKMKVSLAAQTLSASVADSLAFLRDDIHHPDFSASTATEAFVRHINNLFDVLNSRHPFGRGYKSPLRVTNQWIWRDFLLEAREYLLGLKSTDGQPLWQTKRKTPILGFAITISSILGIFDDFVQSGQLDYFLTYKVSQDHLEHFFCCVRSRNGWNNNPSALQFMHSFKRLLLHARVEGHGGNCRVLDSTLLLNVQPSAKDIYNDDVQIQRLCDLSVEEIEEHDYDVLSVNLSLDMYEENVVAYVAGYVVQMVVRCVNCPKCLGSLYAPDETESSTYSLIKRKNRGGLIVPSVGVIRICKYSEKFLRKLLFLHNNRLPRHNSLLDTLVIQICHHFYNNLTEYFPDLHNHYSEGDLFNSHPILLLKCIVKSYCKIRVYNLAKTLSQNIATPNIRQCFGKLILFNHQ